MSQSKHNCTIIFGNHYEVAEKLKRYKVTDAQLQSLFDEIKTCIQGETRND